MRQGSKTQVQLFDAMRANSQPSILACNNSVNFFDTFESGWLVGFYRGPINSAPLMDVLSIGTYY